MANAAGSAKGTMAPESSPPDRRDNRSLVGRLTSITGSALQLAARTGGASLQFGKALLLTPERQKMMEEAGRSLKDLREVAGLTLSELSEAIDLRDKTLLEAVENGTAVLSFELILRLSSLLARHDPVPFIVKYTRTYNPTVWRFLADWGIGRLPLQFERERQFVNVYRGHDAARKLSDEGFEQVLQFTRSAFELSLHFVAEGEKAEDGEV
jgi:transcriptional regulator with XRE-family HTH domain